MFTTTAVRADVEAVIPEATTPEEAVAAIMPILYRHGYDSFDRELSFTMASEAHGWDYDSLFTAWLAGEPKEWEKAAAA